MPRTKEPNRLAKRDRKQKRETKCWREKLKKGCLHQLVFVNKERGQGDTKIFLSPHNICVRARRSGEKCIVLKKNFLN
jgi:hypothetical protein